MRWRSSESNNVRGTVALVGRPNVGKSTLFNRLRGGRDALVADFPGLTRDRHYGLADFDGEGVRLIDTGGLSDEDEGVFAVMADQTEQAIEEADLVVFIVDARSGRSTFDDEIADRLRRQGEVLLVVNKIDGVSEHALYEFSELGFGAPLGISASQGRGIGTLKQVILDHLPEHEQETPTERNEASPEGEGVPGEDRGRIGIAVVGRPNVGKSTLINRLIGEERQVVFDQPGTTRDAIDVPFGDDYLLIDTAGVRRKGKVTEAVEKFSVVKTLAALERAEVALVLLDAREGVVDQDMHLIRYAVDAGAGVAVLVNKWDGLSADARARAKATVSRKLRFVPWVPVRFISALHGTRIKELPKLVDTIFAAGRFETATPELNNILEQALADHPPPLVGGRAIKLRYVHKAGAHPPRLILHGNRTEALPASYLRFLENRYRETLGLIGVPIEITTRTTDNPYADRRNELTQRQYRRRQRLIRHRKKG